MTATLAAERTALQDIATRYAEYEFDRIMRRFMLRTFSPHLRGGSALELGCHHGEFSVLIEPRFDRLSVVDAAESFLEHTRKRLGPKAKLHLSLFETFTSDERFDAVFACHVLEHLIDPVEVLKRAKDLLAPGGTVLIAVPNGNAPSRQIAVHMGIIETCGSFTEADIREGHRRVYFLDTLQADIRRAGLEIVDSGGIFFKPLANFQMDKLIETGLAQDAFLEGCFQLGRKYPDLCASIYAVARAPA